TDPGAVPGVGLQMYVVRDVGRYVMRDIFLRMIRVLRSIQYEVLNMGKPSRKRFQEALPALKAACKNDRLPFTLRVHAAELILAVYGVPLPDSNLRTKRAVRDLVEENAFERSLRQQVHE